MPLLPKFPMPLLPNLKNAKQIAAGGEGVIYEHPTDSSKVIKVYHTPRPIRYKDHLDTLSTLPGQEFIIPIEVYYDRSMVFGFSMRYVNFSDYYLFNNLFNKGFCTSNGFNIDRKISILTALQKCVEFLHKDGVHVGDLNQYNIFFSKNCEVLMVDVDSYQTLNQPHSGVLLDDIRDWCTSKIDAASDSWSYDILAFWASTHCHPFKWVVPGNTETLEYRVKEGRSYLSSIANMKIPPLYQPLAPKLEDQFREIFKGRRYMVDLRGITSLQQVPVKLQPQVASRTLDIRLLYEDVLEVYSAIHRISIKQNSGWSLINTSVRGLTSTLLEFKHEEIDTLYPSATNFCIILDNTLMDSRKMERIPFANPFYYFDSGYLSVLDHNSNIQWNFNIDMQLRRQCNTRRGTYYSLYYNGISKSHVNVFAKSILHRTAPIQNFGLAKYLNVPDGRTYKMYPLHPGVKDVFHNRGCFAQEYKAGTKIRYSLTIGETVHDLEYLPHFAVFGGNVIIPNDGYLELYSKTGSMGVRFDCAECNRDSKLYYTTSGILLLTNNKLYLLNVKSSS